MKRCPSCHRPYADDSLTYCLDDGSILSSIPDPDATLVLPDKRAAGSVEKDTTALVPLPAAHPYFWAGLVLIVLGAVVVGGVAVAFVYEFNGKERSVSTSKTMEATQVPSTKSATPSPEAVPNASPSPLSTQPERGAPMIVDLNGQWELVNTILKSSYPAYVNLELGYRLSIKQQGTEFTGEGEKLSENGRALSSPERTPIKVSGSIAGQMVRATFIEEGARRTTSGTFSWQVAANGTRITGTFISTAAKSSGKCVGTKER